MTDFPIMAGLDRQPMTIPWAMIAPHERQADLNHDQSLERLAQRGGLNACEALAPDGPRGGYRSVTRLPND